MKEEEKVEDHKNQINTSFAQAEMVKRKYELILEMLKTERLSYLSQVRTKK